MIGQRRLKVKEEIFPAVEISVNYYFCFIKLNARIQAWTHVNFVFGNSHVVREVFNTLYAQLSIHRPGDGYWNTTAPMHHHLIIKQNQVTIIAEINTLIFVLTSDQLVEAIANNPILMERPIVINGNKAAIGRPPEKVLPIL